jgi:hypothetical protein
MSVSNFNTEAVNENGSLSADLRRLPQMVGKAASTPGERRICANLRSSADKICLGYRPAVLYALALFVIQSFVNLARAGQPYVVSELLNGHIWRIEDSNGDGDALDLGERTLWGDGFTGAQGMAADSRAVYVTEALLAGGSNQVVRLSDANGDGDALDVGERTIWLDGLVSPRDISFDGGGTWYLSEFDNFQIWRLVDSNHDGDVLDVGEKILFADGVSGPQWTSPQAGTLLVAAGLGGPIHRLADLNGDGDALDVAENLVITPNYGDLVGVMDDGDGGFYFSSFSADTVFHAQDNNGDGDMLDVAEVLSYADSVYGLLDGPAGLTAFDGGGFLLADFFNNQVKLVRDKNGDGDALDLGEVLLFADGIDQPIDIVALPFGLLGDYNRNGTVDAADYTVWRDTLGRMGAGLAADGNGSGTIDAGDYDVWKLHFGEIAGSGSADFGELDSTELAEVSRVGASPSHAAVPEPSALLLAIVAMVTALPHRRRLI